jgi:hypothetical protein
MINWDAIWIKLQELWAGVDQALLATVVLPLLAILIPIVIYRRTTRHQRQLEESRRDQDRREGVYRDLLTLIDPVSQWSRESTTSDTHGVVASPPKLEDGLRVKINIGMDLDDQLNASFWNTSRWWWLEWLEAYQNVLRLAQENEHRLSSLARVRLEAAEIGLRESFRPHPKGILRAWREFKRLRTHAIVFLEEPTFDEWLVGRFRAFRQRLANHAEIRRLVRRERELSDLTTEHFFYTPDEDSARSLAEDLQATEGHTIDRVDPSADATTNEWVVVSTTAFEQWNSDALSLIAARHGGMYDGHGTFVGELN